MESPDAQAHSSEHVATHAVADHDCLLRKRAEHVKGELEKPRMGLLGPDVRGVENAAYLDAITRTDLGLSLIHISEPTRPY